jgi:hypothetical protein
LGVFGGRGRKELRGVEERGDAVGSAVGRTGSGGGGPEGEEVCCCKRIWGRKRVSGELTWKTGGRRGTREGKHTVGSVIGNVGHLVLDGIDASEERSGLTVRGGEVLSTVLGRECLSAVLPEGVYGERVPIANRSAGGQKVRVEAGAHTVNGEDVG